MRGCPHAKIQGQTSQREKIQEQDLGGKNMLSVLMHKDYSVGARKKVIGGTIRKVLHSHKKKFGVYSMRSGMPLEDFKQKSNILFMFLKDWLLSEEWTIGGKLEAGHKLGGYFRVQLGPSFYGINDVF